MAEEHSIELDGARLKYHHRRPLAPQPLSPVILLHPWFGCWQFWQRTVEGLPEFETYSLDLYSLGGGAGWQSFASPQGLARAVGMMMDALGIERCGIIANSMGGIAAQALAAAEADRIDKLILVGTGARVVGVKPDFRQTLEEWVAGKEGRELTEQLVGSLFAKRPQDPQEFETFVAMVINANRAFMASVLTNAFELDLRPALPQITARTLIIRGELDAARTRTHVEELLAGIQNSRAVEIPDAGHSPQVDSPQAFLPLVRGFLFT
jgi:3-oxoadipate enol-lactonase